MKMKISFKKMSKINIYLYFLILLSIILIVKTDEIKEEKNSESQTEQKQEGESKPEQDIDPDDNNYYDEDGDQYFKESLKQYLVERNLFESDQLIQPEEMKKIFLEVITEGDAESSAEYFGGIFIELADHFVNEYYRERKEIRGKDIFELIDMEPISKKFEQLMSDNSKYNGADDNNEYQDYNNYDNDYNDYDYDYRDDVGEPIYDY